MLVAARIFTLVLSAACLAQSSAEPARENPVRITSGPVVEEVTDSTATIAWSTNVNAGTTLHYGTEPDDLNLMAAMPWGGLTHRVYLKGLKAGTTYYFQAESGDAQGTGSKAQSDPSLFQTKLRGQPAAASEAAH